MQLIVLIEDHFPTVPGNVKVNEFGSESIVDPETGPRGFCVNGTSAFLDGPEDAVVAWIEACGGSIWTSNNPMFGGWKKKTLAKD